MADTKRMRACEVWVEVEEATGVRALRLVIVFRMFRQCQYLPWHLSHRRYARNMVKLNRGRTE